MQTVWLQPNRRVLALGMLMPSLLLIVGIAMLVAFRFGQSSATIVWWCGVVLLVLGGGLACVILRAICQPRLAYDEPNLLVYLRTTVPIRLPIDVVECFFEGQAPSMVGELDVDDTRSKAIVVRLAEAAKEWQKVEVNPILGRWSDGYITINGTWCEPLSRDLIVRLNKQMVESKRQLGAAEEE